MNNGICYNSNGGGRPLSKECRWHAAQQGWELKMVRFSDLFTVWHLVRDGELEVFRCLEDLWEAMGRPIQPVK